MFFQHPEIYYLEATINHEYQYLYFRLITTDIYSYSLDRVNVVNERVPEMFTTFPYPNSLISLD